MTKYFNLNGSFDDELLVTFFDTLNMCTPEDTMEIHLNSEGGAFYILENLLEVVNSRPDLFKIVTTERSHSCALYFLIFANCKKKVTRHAWGIFHQSSRSLPVSTTKKFLGDDATFFINDMKDSVKFENFCVEKFGLTPKERKAFNSGKDVYLNSKRLNQLINLNLSYEEANNS